MRPEEQQLHNKRHALNYLKITLTFSFTCILQGMVMFCKYFSFWGRLTSLLVSLRLDKKYTKFRDRVVQKNTLCLEKTKLVHLLFFYVSSGIPLSTLFKAYISFNN